MTLPPRPDGRFPPPSSELLAALETGPFSRALQLAITRSGYKLSAIERRLAERGRPIARSTLSYWQQGHRQPERSQSQAALALLEEILEVPSGSLRDLVGPPRPRGRWLNYRRAGREWEDLWTDTDAIAQVLSSEQRRENSRFQELITVDTFSIGVSKELQWHEYQQLFRAREDGANRIVLLYRANPDVDIDAVRVEPLLNCRLGRQRTLPAAGIAAFELLLDRRLRAGETHFMSYRQISPPVTAATRERLAGPNGPHTDEMISGRVFRSPIHSFVMHARFDPSMLPVRCFGVRLSRIGAREEIMSELPLTVQHTAHFSLQSSNPAAYAMRWEWQ